MSCADSRIRGFIAALLYGALLLNGSLLYAVQEEENSGSSRRSLFSAVQALESEGVLDNMASNLAEEYLQLRTTYEEEENSEARGEHASELLHLLDLLDQDFVGGLAREESRRLLATGDPRVEVLAVMADDVAEKCGVLASDDFQQDQTTLLENGGPLQNDGLDDALTDCLNSAGTYDEFFNELVEEFPRIIDAERSAIEKQEEECEGMTGSGKDTCVEDVDERRTQLAKVENTNAELQEMRRERRSSGGGCGLSCFLGKLFRWGLALTMGPVVLVVGGPEAYGDFMDSLDLVETKGVETIETGTDRTVTVRKLGEADRQQPGEDFLVALRDEGFQDVPYYGDPEGLAVHFKLRDGELRLYMGAVLRARVLWDCDTDGSATANVAVLPNSLRVECMGDLENWAFDRDVLDDETVSVSGGRTPTNRFQLTGTAQTGAASAVRFSITEGTVGAAPPGSPKYLLTVEGG